MFKPEAEALFSFKNRTAFELKIYMKESKLDYKFSKTKGNIVE